MAAIAKNFFECTLKRFFQYRENNPIALVPQNASCPPYKIFQRCIACNQERFTEETMRGPILVLQNAVYTSGNSRIWCKGCHDKFSITYNQLFKKNPTSLDDNTLRPGCELKILGQVYRKLNQTVLFELTPPPAP